MSLHTEANAFTSRAYPLREVGKKNELARRGNMIDRVYGTKGGINLLYGKLGLFSTHF